MRQQTQPHSGPCGEDRHVGPSSLACFLACFLAYSWPRLPSLFSGRLRGANGLPLPPIPMRLARGRQSPKIVNARGARACQWVPSCCIRPATADLMDAAGGRGCSSGVEHYVANVRVVGSNPIARSNVQNVPTGCPRGAECRARDRGANSSPRDLITKRSRQRLARLRGPGRAAA
jgi:hypothetical protein